MSDVSDERVVWVREKPGRKLVQTIEPIPQGFSVTTEWFQNGELHRRDCEIALREGLESKGAAQHF